MISAIYEIRNTLYAKIGRMTYCVIMNGIYLIRRNPSIEIKKPILPKIRGDRLLKSLHAISFELLQQ
jgi:hypothetical protein